MLAFEVLFLTWPELRGLPAAGAWPGPDGG
jgi:hypothetical protein